MSVVEIQMVIDDLRLQWQQADDADELMRRTADPWPVQQRRHARQCAAVGSISTSALMRKHVMIIDVRLKAIVFLPAEQHGYSQPPYEEISQQRYEQMAARIQTLQGDLPHEQPVGSAVLRRRRV